MSDLVITSNRLFAAEEWEVVFNAFRNVNINPFDYSTINESLYQYIKANNPEEYRRYSNAGIMRAHIELFSRLAHSLSYRYEKTTRENFYDSIENRESVIELAKVFSYQPKRNRGANGQCKITGIRTTEPLFDATGQSIANTTVRWNQDGDDRWYEKFVKILNGAISPTNPVGKPLERKTLYNIRHELYPINRIQSSTITPTFKGKVNGRSYSFEAVSTIIDEIIKESAPNPFNAFNIIYKNDSNGNFSPNTGFFVQFKQGTLNREDYTFTDPMQNREISIDIDNINETDLWVCEIHPDGFTKEVWTPIDSMEGQNLVYEKEFNKNDRIYTVTSRDKNQVTVNFGDGVNGAIPFGSFRIWYRTSENERFIIRANDIQSVPITIPYQGKDGETYQLTIYLTNVSDIDNAEPEESLNSIKRNAPLSHYTQERMINGEDYNVYPLIQTSLILKTKTVNRTHHGHTRYTDIYDKDSSISKITLHASDGFIYADGNDYLQRIDLLNNIDATKEVQNAVNRTVQSREFKTAINASIMESGIPMSANILWRTLPRRSTVYDRGYFTVNGQVSPIGENALCRELRHVTPEAQLFFNDDHVNSVEYAENNGLVNPSIASIGSIKLTKYEQDGAIITGVIPTINVDDFEYEDFEEFGELITNRQNFNLYYRLYEGYFTTDETADDAIFVQSYEFIESTLEEFYRVQSPVLSYIVGSDRDIKFFFKDIAGDARDPITGEVVQDYISIGTGNIGLRGEPTFLMRRDKTKDITIFKHDGDSNE